MAVVIVEGACIGLGSLMILVTLIHLLIYEKLKTTYLLVQSQVRNISAKYSGAHLRSYVYSNLLESTRCAGTF